MTTKTQTALVHIELTIDTDLLAKQLDALERATDNAAVACEDHGHLLGLENLISELLHYAETQS